MWQRMLSIIAIALATGFCAQANAGLLASGATISHLANTSNDSTTFALQLVGGSGPCTGGTIWIWFPVSAAADADAHKRAYATAMMAIATGLRVSIHNYTNDNCDGASYIEVYP
jgi:hypothetical protein